MPEIAQFNAPVEGPRPNDEAASAAREAAFTENRFIRQGAEAIGGAISKVGGRIGEMVDQHDAMQEISHGSASWASLYNDLSNKWSALANNSDPNDTSIDKDFDENILGPALDKFTEAFNTPAGQKWAVENADRMRTEFYRTTSADMATRASLATAQNITNVKNGLSVAVRDNPSSLDFAADSVDATVGSIISAAPRLDPKNAAELRGKLIPEIKTNLARSAYEGMLEKNPQAALDALNSGAFDKFGVSGTDKYTMQRLGESAIRLQTTSQRAQQELQDRQDKEAAQTFAGKAYAAAMRPDGTFAPGKDFFDSMKQLYFMPQGFEIAKAGMSAADSAVRNPTIISDPHLRDSLWSRALAPDATSDQTFDRDVYTAIGHQQLSPQDATQLFNARSKMANDPALKQSNKALSDFLKGQKSAFTRGNALLGVKDPMGDQAFADYQRSAQYLFDKAYESGAYKPGSDNAGFWRELKTLGSNMSPYRKGGPLQSLIPQPATPEDALKLKRGTLYLTPQGEARVR